MVQIVWTPGCFADKNDGGLYFLDSEDFFEEMEKKLALRAASHINPAITGRIESVEMWPRVYDPVTKKTNDLVIMHMSDQASAHTLIHHYCSVTLDRVVGGIKSFIGVSFCELKHDLSKLQTYKDIGYHLDMLHATNLEMKAIGAEYKYGGMCPTFPDTWVDAAEYEARYKQYKESDKSGRAAQAFLLGHRPVPNLKAKQTRVDELYEHKLSCVWKLRQFQIEGVPLEFEHSD